MKNVQIGGTNWEVSNVAFLFIVYFVKTLGAKSSSHLEFSVIRAVLRPKA